MINQVVLVGRLTKDPELKYTQGSGKAVARFTLAVNRPFANSNGEKDADFINCICWNGIAQALADHQQKGNLIGVIGRIQTSSYQGQDGKTVYKTEVVADAVQFLEPKQSNGKKSNKQGQSGGQQGQYNGQYGNPQGQWGQPPQQQQGQPNPYPQQSPYPYQPPQQTQQPPYPYNDPFGPTPQNVPVINEEDLPF